MIYRLLRRNISAAQTIGYMVAALVGMTVLAVGLRFWSDVSVSSQGVSSYVVVQKHVTTSFFGNANEGFTPQEISDIESQPWAKRVGSFTSAECDVAARVSGLGRSMSTALFLESVPDEMMDVRPEGWNAETDYSSGKATVPVVIPKEYLSLYNYGFAPSRGLPQVDEATVGLIPIELSVSGGGHQQTLRARIAGFSSRINTIAVPEGFIRWANSQFASDLAQGPSRLIIETVRPGDPDALKWIRDHGYETTADSAAERIGSLASVGSTIVVGIGIVILLLSLFILTLSIHLLLYKNRPMLFELMQLGYSPRSVGAPYMKLTASVNLAVGAVSLGIMSLLRPLWMAPLKAAGLQGGSPAVCILTIAAIAIMLTLLNCFTIHRMVVGAFRR